jgi:hypothetical protein
MAESLSPGQFRFLRYWSLNMKLARAVGQGSFPGFAYEAEERARMDALAAGAHASAVLLWLAAAAATYVLIALVAMAVVFGTALATVWRSSLPEAQFFAAMLLVLVAMIGLGLPLSIGAGGWIADAVWRARPDQAPGDTQLFAKVRRQFLRIAIVTGGLFVAASLGWGALLGLH